MILPVSKNTLLISALLILLTSTIAGVGYFYVQALREKNQLDFQAKQAALDQDRAEAEAKAEAEAAKVQLAAEQDQKEYIAKRKAECYSLYEKERAKWNNVKGNTYDEEDDVCLIHYKATADTWAGQDCSELIPDLGASDVFRRIQLRSWIDCRENQFTNEF